jgi:hypothetical protein
MHKITKTLFRLWLPWLVCLGLLLAPGSVAVSDPGDWWEVTPEPEVPSPYYDSILYSEIAPKLHEIMTNSDRVQVEVMGQSAGGRNMFLVTVAHPEAFSRKTAYQAIRKQMLLDPEQAQGLVEKFPDFKVPVFINGSIHGNEYPGVDASIRLIETLAYDNSPEVLEILDNLIVLINVVQNPDGRVLGTRSNSNGIDINRDFITQSQPETRATVKALTEWNPMIMLDLHGFVNPMLIEPCTPPHNPNYEYDLYITWALEQAKAMEAELFARTGFTAQIPFRDFDLGWDDWPPTYAPMYAMFHGSYGHTMETSYRDLRGVDAHYWAVWGALKFASQNRVGMINDQIEIFRRGFLGLPKMTIPDFILDQTAYDQYLELMEKTFPAAYVIPPDTPAQQSDHQVARLVNFLLFNDVRVEKALENFTLDGEIYPAGSYIVWIKQPKRGLANTILEDGVDLSFIEGLQFYSPPSVWSNPNLWGVKAYSFAEEFSVATVPVTSMVTPYGMLQAGPAAGYAFEPLNLAAFQVVNMLLRRGEPVYRLATPYDDGARTLPAGTFLVRNKLALAKELTKLWHLDVYPVKKMPAGLKPLHLPRIAVSGDSGVTESLKRLGFSYTTLTTAQLNAGAINNYDLFVNQATRWTSLNADGQSYFTSWFNAGGDLVGLGTRAAAFATGSGMLDASFAQNDGNAIVKIDYTAGDTLAAGFPSHGRAFAFTPVWFTTLGSNVQVTGYYAADEFVISGFWPNWPASGAAGLPAIVHTAIGNSDISVLGIDVTFRGHPEDSSRLLGNAIFDAQE